MAVVLGAVDEAHNVGVLLYGTRLTEVGELRALILVATVFKLTVELGEGYYRYIQLLGELLEASRYGTHLLS